MQTACIGQNSEAVMENRYKSEWTSKSWYYTDIIFLASNDFQELMFPNDTPFSLRSSPLFFLFQGKTRLGSDSGSQPHSLQEKSAQRTIQATASVPAGWIFNSVGDILHAQSQVRKPKPVTQFLLMFMGTCHFKFKKPTVCRGQNSAPQRLGSFTVWKKRAMPDFHVLPPTHLELKWLVVSVSTQTAENFDDWSAIAKSHFQQICWTFTGSSFWNLTYIHGNCM